MTKMMKAALAAGMLLTPLAASAQNVPAAVVAVVDVQRVYSECTACRAANTQIQNLVTQGNARAQALGAPLNTEGQALQTEARRVGALPAGAAKTAAETALRTRLQTFERNQANGQQELGRLQQNIESTRANVLRQINERLNPIISQVMQQRGANIAVDQNATLAAARTVDITDSVLTALNAALPSVSVTPLPQQAQPAQQQPQQPRPAAPRGR